ncbi:hypothetical protein Cassandra_0306 [Pseudomonas phage Cassandra]|nr:hypothetical protein Cassandra_0306 [Pseudomonas phage Cassandra]WPK39502.1 hypothetical protein Deiofobo_0305 [Pseudomonas phage Deifobo]
MVMKKGEQFAPLSAQLGNYLLSCAAPAIAAFFSATFSARSASRLALRSSASRLAAAAFSSRSFFSASRLALRSAASASACALRLIRKPLPLFALPAPSSKTKPRRRSLLPTEVLFCSKLALSTPSNTRVASSKPVWVMAALTIAIALLSRLSSVSGFGPFCPGTFGSGVYLAASSLPSSACSISRVMRIALNTSFCSNCTTVPSASSTSAVADQVRLLGVV